MKREDYNEAEAREFVWNHLWRADSHVFVNCPILDIVEVDSLGNVPKWLFTTRDGEIKSKSAKNRNLAAVEKGLRCHVDKCEHGFHGYFCSPTSQDWYAIQSYEHLQELLQKHSSDMAIVPHPHPDSANAKFLEIKLWREEKNAVLEPKIKCFWLSHASAAGKVKRNKRRNTDMNLPQERLICRNNALIDTAKSFAFSLLAQLENRSNIKVHQFDFIVHVAEILSSVTGPDSGEASKIFRVHFHHATHINFDNLGSISALQRRKSEQFSQSIGEFSTKLSSHGFLTRQASIMSSMASSTTYIKPWTYCSGVFCTYAAMAADGSGAAEPSMGLDFEEGDVLVESQRAIQRHRPSGGSFDASNGDAKSEGSPSRKGSRSSQRGGGTPTAGTVDLGLNETADGVQNRKKGDDVTGNEARVGTLLPLKSNKILYKNLVLVRDEIRRLEEIDRQYIDEAHDTSEKLDSIYSMREAMKSIWPLPLIKWWFAHGQFYAATQSSKGGIGRLPATVNPEAIVPPSVLSKLEKDKLKRMGSNRQIINETIADTNDEEQDPNKEEDESEEEEDEESMGPNGRKNGKLRPPKLPKEPPTAMSLSLPEAIANPLSTANPAIPFSNKTNMHLSDTNYPSRQSLLNNPEDTKWFSLHHQDVAVCDRCYLVYCRLESFRKGKFNKIREALKQEKREKLNPEEQRQRDREIERRIFAQKQSTYKLSQSKPRRNDQGEYDPTPTHRFFANRGGSISSSNLSTTSSAATSGHAPKGALPPLPWRLNDDEERDRYLAPASHSVAEKLMKKQPLRSMSAEPGTLGLDGESMSTSGVSDVEAAWDAMMQTAQKRMNNVGKNLPPLPAGLGNTSNGLISSQSNGSLTSIAPLRRPTNLTAQQTSLKVAVDQYTAENLLHPWQRDLKKLKEALHDVSGLNPVNKNLTGMTGLQNKLPLENISSKGKASAVPTMNQASIPSDSGSNKGPGTLAKSVSFRLNEIDSGSSERLPTSPLKSASSNRPGTSAQGSSRGGGSQGVNGNLSSPFGSPMRGIRSIGIADSHDEDDEDDDMDIAGGGLGWNPFVIQQAH